MQKKTISVILFFGLIFSVLCISLLRVNVLSVFANESTTNDMCLTNSHKSIEIYDQAINAFIWETLDEVGEKQFTYSNDFSGVWIDDQGFLNIG